MTIQQNIINFENTFGKKLPSFYVDFLTANNLQNSKLFNNLTLIYGVEELADRQDGMQQYLPNFIKIGDDNNGYGVFIRVGNAPNQTMHDTAIYITELGDLTETSLEKLAENFADWAKREYDTEIFLENLYHKKTQFKRAQINAPIVDLKQQISDLNKQLNAISHQKGSGKLDLKIYLLQKKEIEANKEILAKQLVTQESELLQVNNHEASRAAPLINTRIIENTFDVKLPILYKKLADDGMLEYANAFGSDWYKKVFPSLKTQPPFLLFAKSFELMSLREVYAEVREMQSYTHWLPNFKMVPFAGDGSGDKFAFYWPEKILNNGIEPPFDVEPQVIHWWHDSDHCDVKAKNLQDFIFIQLLTCAFGIEEDEDIVAEGDITTNLNNMLATHERYLTASQAQILKAIYARDLQQNNDGVFLLSLDEYKQILQKELGYSEDLGSFIYTKE